MYNLPLCGANEEEGEAEDDVIPLLQEHVLPIYSAKSSIAPYPQ